MFFSIVCLFVLYVGFALNLTCLQPGMDGMTWAVQAKSQLENRPPFTQTGVSPLEGSFDAPLQLFHDYVLPSAIVRIATGELPSKLTTFFVLAVFLFLAAYWLARIIRVDRPTALLGAFLLPLSAFPGFATWPSQFYILFTLTPDPGQLIGLSALIVAALWALDGRGPRIKYLLLPVPLICLMWAILGFAAYLPLMIPATMLYGGASLLDARRLRDNVPRAIAMLAMIAIPAALGTLTYVYGLYRYTTFTFFPHEFEMVRSDLLFASTFWTSSYAACVIVLGLVGAVWTAYVDEGRLRLFAWTYLVVTVLFLVTAVVLVRFSPGYRGVSPVYIETCFWPYTLIFAAVAITKIARAIGHLSSGTTQRPTLLWMARNSGASMLVLSLGLAAAFNTAVAARGRPSHCRDYGVSSLKPTAITEILQRNVAIKPGASFNGIAATIDGIAGRPSVTWQSLHGYDIDVWNATGNEHRIPGLWNYAIPTLFQYNSFRSPPYYLVLTDFFTRPSDRQERSGLVLSRIHPPMLRLLGVRYVITDIETDAGKVVAELQVKGRADLRLVELAGVNLGDYSPTKLERVPDFRSGLAALHAPNFDGKRMVLTDTEIAGPFVPAQLTTLVYQRDGFQLRAESTGASMLVLPIQYSHCWSAEGEGAPELFRANLMQLGVRFRGKLDAKLVFRFGPILAGACRIEDLHDMTRLRVAEARTNRQ